MYNKLNLLKKAIENLEKYHGRKKEQDIQYDDLRIEIQREANIGMEQANSWINDFIEQGYLKYKLENSESIFIECKDWDQPYKF
jgi:hypothetical protein